MMSEKAQPTLVIHKSLLRPDVLYRTTIPEDDDWGELLHDVGLDDKTIAKTTVVFKRKPLFWLSSRKAKFGGYSHLFKRLTIYTDPQWRVYESAFEDYSERFYTLPINMGLTLEQRQESQDHAQTVMNASVVRTAAHEAQHEFDASRHTRAYILSTAIKTSTASVASLALWIVGVPAPLAIAVGTSASLFVDKAIYKIDPLEVSARQTGSEFADSGKIYQLVNITRRYPLGR